ncbi:fimbrillin family protein [Sphingobacterium griseoflavum]|uniref:Fimbrillin-A associated anchor s Mfa1 and Mfa2 family protein n=1 Tax=Sphingobacterium griseoflavum TaxID=1474952 RepID=A0ABQ3I142_9SPHI|nr:fimbrillin family protein [Sphingobacterium griseoflavum]GHE39528.1 hypothetical protein GCM10017764_23460 [Sphingobacterium griseoflavum]
MNRKDIMRHAVYGLAGWLAVLSLYSCSKTADSGTTIGEARVTVRVAGVELGDDGELGPDGSGAQAQARKANAGKLVQHADMSLADYSDDGELVAVVPFSDDLMIFASLKEEGTVSKQRQAVARSGNKANVVSTPLQPGVRYRMVIFDATGAYVDQREYIHGQEDSAPALLLDAGNTYTFVAYSFNNSTAIAPFPTNRTLATAGLSALSGQFLYYKQAVELVYGTNNLGIVLKHMFSQISTVLTLGNSTQGNIEGISGSVLRPTRASASIAFGNSSMAYGATVSNGAPVTFPSVGGGVRTVNGEPVMLIAPTTTNGTFQFEMLTIDRYTRRDITIPGIKINPGKRYTLTLRVDICVNRTAVALNSDGGAVRTYSANNANQGFIADFTELDNSFRFQVNGNDVIRNANDGELQFSNSSTHPRNIQFTDGTQYGVEHTHIWYVQGTATNPAIRLVIDPNGQVALFGSKESGGALFPLVPMAGFRFATPAELGFNPNGNNSIRISQQILGPTIMRGTVGSRRRCTS